MAASETPSETRTPRVHRNALIEVTLPGGDIVALSLTGNLLELEGDERGLVFGLRDTLAEYRKTHATSALESVGLGSAKAAPKNGKTTAPAEASG
jgi:hypothetical protein